MHIIFASILTSIDGLVCPGSAPSGIIAAVSFIPLLAFVWSALPWGQIAGAAGSLFGGLFGGRGNQVKPNFELQPLPEIGYTFDPTSGNPRDINTQANAPELRQPIDLGKRAKYLQNLFPGLIGGMSTAGQQLTGAGQGLIGDAAGDFGQARDFYTRLLTGDAAATSEALAPEINRTNQLTQQAISNIEQFGPRGGGRNAALNQARIGRAGTLAGIYAGARPMAAAGITQLGQAAGNLGVSTVGQGLNAGNIAGNLGLGVDQQDLNRASTQAQLNLTRASNLAGLDLDRENFINNLLLNRGNVIGNLAQGQDRIRLGQAQLGQNQRQNSSNFWGGIGTLIGDVVGEWGKK